MNKLGRGSSKGYFSRIIFLYGPFIFDKMSLCFHYTNPFKKGAQWLSGRVLDLRPKGDRFEPHQPHCIVVLEQDTFILA